MVLNLSALRPRKSCEFLKLRAASWTSEVPQTAGRGELISFQREAPTGEEGGCQKSIRRVESKPE